MSLRLTILRASHSVRRVPLVSSCWRALSSLASNQASLIHRAMLRLDRPPPGFRDLWLKHHFDSNLVYVNPDDIEYRLGGGSWRSRTSEAGFATRVAAWYHDGDLWKHIARHPSRNFHGRFVAGGVWDEAAQPYQIFPTVRQLFQEGLETASTDEYQRLHRKIASGEALWTQSARTTDELDDYFRAMIETYRGMEREGYKDQVALGGEGWDEIRVAITRTGSLCIVARGNHRLAMARLLNIAAVPVFLGRVHQRWLDVWMRREGFDDPVTALRVACELLESPEGVDRIRV